MSATVTIKASTLARQADAVALASRLGLPCDTHAQFDLLFTDERLQLCLNSPDAPGPLSVDFVGGRAGHRRQFGGGRNQPMAKAAGLKQGVNPHILDATAGLGSDGFVFATLGCQVTMIEQNPVIFALLEDGLKRGLAHDDIAKLCQQITLISADSTKYLQRCIEKPDVIYLDPMYPHREKSALVKKEMRLFQLLLGEAVDSRTLLATALGCAKKRVVVKRPKGAETLSQQRPTMTISSKNTRYDVYVIAAMKS